VPQQNLYIGVAGEFDPLEGGHASGGHAESIHQSRGMKWVANVD
jgi:hypothetical protein